MTRAFPPRMTQLHGRDRFLRFDELNNAPIGWNMLVGPYTRARIRLAASLLDGSLFRENDGRPANSEPAEMDKVPVGGSAINGHVLAHRRNHDPVAQLQ